ncbi:hypothetical protein SAMN05216570_0949 [Dyella sp. OK004]|uniref:hypothetical protein n=1 Tax=Dyella sp. OK004 TaxID=1855292 RepID=UPI0008F10984|nr:hypothetical protein [Dyella sp. OK004]SFR94210.1 hypothetical protein SAMN05216570_0949 [Dyella sp. OK004]
MPRIDPPPGAMNLSELPSTSLTPSLAGIGAAHALAGQGGSARLQAAHGNQLLGLDVWAGTSAAERLLSRPGAATGPAGAQLEQVISHILAPLG